MTVSKQITVEKITGVALMRRACEMTMHGQTSKASLDKLYKAEHSPIRTQLFWIELVGIPTFVSVHFVRHKIGVEHFVKSMRDDLYIDPDDYSKVDRNTPLHHGMFINAQSLIQLSRKRLCLKSHHVTGGWMQRIRKQVRKVDEDLYRYMVPECVYRNGYCPEMTECDPGLSCVVAAYERESI